MTGHMTDDVGILGGSAERPPVAASVPPAGRGLPRKRDPRPRVLGGYSALLPVGRDGILSGSRGDDWKSKVFFLLMYGVPWVYPTFPRWGGYRPT